MKIAIIGSMVFAEKMLKIQEELKRLGHEALVPVETDKYVEDKNLKHKRDKKITISDFRNLIKADFDRLNVSDATLVLNFDKNNIADYIGSSAFTEITYAFIKQKKIFLYNAAPNQDYIFDDLIRMNVIAIEQDLTKI
ncbi:MAG: hypothetical protein GY793_09590 [Proteobacteria bacterium]|nr:hypothetical protein [Pseudomonadota bacterium]